METVLLINKHVENVLEDRPSREEVLGFLDQIKSLENMEHSITYFIREEREFSEVRTLWRFINTSELSVDFLRIFYYELPVELYNWLNTYTFREIIDQIILYMACLNSNNSDRSIVEEDIYPPLLDLLEKKTEQIINQKVPFSFVKKLIRDGTLSKDLRLEPWRSNIIRYLYLFYTLYDTYPIEPLMQLGNATPEDHRKKNSALRGSHWYEFTKGFDFVFKIFISQKYYRNLEDSSLK